MNHRIIKAYLWAEMLNVKHEREFDELCYTLLFLSSVSRDDLRSKTEQSKLRIQQINEELAQYQAELQEFNDKVKQIDLLFFMETYFQLNLFFSNSNMQITL